ncbi:MAG: hypothetical protein ACAH88_20780, partial [Roseimicrobium sp.]
MSSALKRVLFVCTGNTCRSPMAEALFRGLVAEREDYDVISAGVGAHDGDFPSTYTVQLLRELGFDLSDHRSRQISPDLIQGVTHIFAMSAGTNGSQSARTGDPGDFAIQRHRECLTAFDKSPMRSKLSIPHPQPP